MPSLKLPGLGGQTEIIAGPLNCVRAYGQTCAYLYIWVWRSEVHSRCLPLSLASLFFETLSD